MLVDLLRTRRAVVKLDQETKTICFHNNKILVLATHSMYMQTHALEN